MLDEFSATKIEDKKPAPTAAAPSGPALPTAEAQPDEDEFAKELQNGMSDLLGQFGSNPEMQQEFEKMMKELGMAAAAQGAAPGLTEPNAQTAVKAGVASDKAAPKKAQGEDSFQETIRKTMERMQNSGETASAAAASSSEEDMLAKMLKEMESGNFPGMDGTGNEEDFNKMLLGMMEQLTNKDILYEPMKELHDKYPAWLESNQKDIKKDDLIRYKEQQSLVGEIIGRFERPGYSDDNQADRDFIVERMQKVCQQRRINQIGRI